MDEQTASVRLKNWRERYGLSQRALGECLGISQEYVCQLEGGKKTPGLSVASAIERKTNGEIPSRDWADPSVLRTDDVTVDESRGAA